MAKHKIEVFMAKTFRRGTHPPTHKRYQDFPLNDFKVPDKLYVSLSQHIGAPAKAVVSVGDSVKEGQLIGEAAGFVSANIFAPVSGTVSAIVKLPTANGGEADHIVIDNDFRYEKSFLPILSDPTKEQIVERIREAGIVGMGGACFPTHVKFSPNKPVDTLIVNGAECEPYITCDCRLLLECAGEFLRGVKYEMKALGVEQAFIGIESNKRPVIDLLKKMCPSGISVVSLITKYPQGAEKQLIYSVTRRIVPAGGLPADVGCVVSNVHTAYAVARAIEVGEPLYKRAMTIAGKGVMKRGNFWMRTGVKHSFIYDECRGSVPEEATRKVISGGPMMGFAQATLDTTTTKGSSALMFFDKKQTDVSEPTQCISCGRCIQCCPMNLLPKDVDRFILRGNYDEIEKLGVMNCIECGVCSYTCPAKRPLVQSMRLAKKEIKARGAKK